MKAISFKKKILQNFLESQDKEYLETNLLGTYSSSTILNCNSRKYHGLFVPRQDQIGIDNYVLLSTLFEQVIVNDQKFNLNTAQFPDVTFPVGHKNLQQFELNKNPRWTYNLGKHNVEKELLLVPTKNQLIIKYRNSGPSKITLQLHPLLANRRIHDLNQANPNDQYNFYEIKNGMVISYKNSFDPLYLQLSSNCTIKEEKLWYFRHFYPIEKERGYEAEEDLLHPGWIQAELAGEDCIYLSVSLQKEDLKNIESRFQQAKKAHRPIKDLESALERAADQFISKTERGTEICAGYHWFGRWGRDTFIALPGLLLAKGRTVEAEAVIDAMVSDIEGGLLTNIGVGDKKEYNSVDASLWLFWTFYELEQKSRNKSKLWTKYQEIIKSILSAYQQGTFYNIHQQEDGLLYAGAPHAALTWMDAKVENEGVTPRRGCPVEINALWYHAIMLALDWAKQAKDEIFIKKWNKEPAKIKKSFIQQFWSEEKGYLADVIHHQEIDWSVRPNQIFAVSLPYSMLAEKHAKKVIKKVEQELFTPFGLRTLSPKDKRYFSCYEGDQKTRDKRYHQGIIWPWLLGAYFDSLWRYNRASFTQQLQKIKTTFAAEMSANGLGSVSELYHETPNFKGTGTISQAWSVSEIYRIIQLDKQGKP